MKRDELFPIIKTAFRIMGAEHDSPGPRPLKRALDDAANNHGLRFSAEDFADALDVLLPNDVNDNVRRLFTQYLHKWDYLVAAWCKDSQPNTPERRLLVYELLELPPATRERCDALIPARTDTDKATLIADEHVEWYTPERKSERHFYWQAYTKALSESWNGESIVELDRTTDLVLEHISDPCQEKLYQTKGLVVGYVQSGKTSHFTGVIAKAVDAGYRLIIVLAGTLDILRNQTQRRLDKLLIGKELIRKYTAAGVDHDYFGDKEWPAFVDHGALPSDLGEFDWHRLTGATVDYKSLLRGLPALEFERKFQDRPLNVPENLHKVVARLLVIKKNPTILKRFKTDLLSLMRTPLHQIPTLVIDDESDQASVNTARPPRKAKDARDAKEAKEAKEAKKLRSKTNQYITDILQSLPRAQYVAYTATPFANVFIDPEDAQDLFPKDFIVALKRPAGYMGASDFFDWQAEKPAGMESNEAAFVRPVKGDDAESENLPRAIDAFILSGAIKLYRERKSNKLKFPHHTMMVHSNYEMDLHDKDAETVKRLFDRGAYDSKAALKRLGKLYTTDFLAVSAIRLEQRVPRLPAFEDLTPYIAQCFERVSERPVSVVNGDSKRREDAPDFDKEEVWRILVGGTKLSRGYTVEGLTISYYRRKARNSDTLMQMGRWFGFRRGYRDLIRLYIGREEEDKDGPFDLYAAFRALCLDEEGFRSKLDRYSNQSKPRITPRQIPPLVPSHMLPPTSRNKMYNAVLASENYANEWSEKTFAPTIAGDVQHNERITRDLLAGSRCELVRLAASVGGTKREGNFHVALLDRIAVAKYLESYKWSKPENFAPVLEFIQSKLGDPELKSWVFLAPQTEAAPHGVWTAAEGTQIAVVDRARDGSDRYKAYTEPRHRAIAEAIVNGDDWVPKTPSDHNWKPANKATEELRQKGRAALLFYPCRDLKNKKHIEKLTTMGFALYFPTNHIQQLVAYKVRDASKPEQVVVDVRKEYE